MTKQILVVDDSRDTRRLLRSILEFEGFNVLEVDSGMETIKTITSRKDIAAVLLDLNIPNGDGHFVMRKTRHLKSKYGFKICVVSGSSDEDSIKTSIEEGADDYITKGVDHDILVHKLRKLLDLCPENEGKFFHSISCVRAEIALFGADIPVMISQLSEVEIQIESKQTFRENTHLTVKCSYLDGIFGKNNFCLHVRTSKATKRHGRYVYDCEIIGLPERFLSKLRNLVVRGRYISDRPSTIH